MNPRFLIPCLFLLFSSVQADDSFTTVLYPVDPSLFDLSAGPDPFGGGGGDPFGGGGDPFGGGGDPFGGGGADPFAHPAPAPALAPNFVLDFFETFMEFPEGSKASYLPRLGKVRLTSSPAAHKEFSALLKQIDPPPVMVSIDYTLFSLASNEVQKSAVYRDTGSLSNEEVLRLFRAGHATLLSLCKVVTLSGVNAQVESVDEIIYPTEFELEASRFGSNRPPATVTPGAFETRETGHIFNVTPTIAPNHKIINLAMIPEKAELIGWIDYDLLGQTEVRPERRSRLAQPVFRSHNITTSLVVFDGQPAVMGGAPHPDTGEPIYSIVTARIIRAEAKASE